jgi:uncharacterized membrane protein
MSYLQLAYLHLATIIPAFLIGSYLLINRKGTLIHKSLGKIYMVLMLVTAFITLFMPAKVGLTFLGHFGFIHLFSFLTFATVIGAYLSIRRGNIQAHRANMLGLYIGGILIAGAFTFVPGRLLHTWLFM